MNAGCQQERAPQFVLFFFLHGYLPVVITLAFAVRLCWILVFDPKPMSDFSFYFQCAESIAKGFGYVKHGGFATVYFPVGYSLFLGMLFWVSGISIAVAQTANLVLSAISLVLVYWIARRDLRIGTNGKAFRSLPRFLSEQYRLYASSRCGSLSSLPAPPWSGSSAAMYLERR